MAQGWGCVAMTPPRMTDAISRLAWPGGAARRSPRRHPGVPRASAGTPSARGVGVPAIHATPAAPRPDPRAARPAVGRRAAGGRPAAGTRARRRAVDRCGSPPRGPRGGAGDRGARGWRAWSGRPAPSGGGDAPRPELLKLVLPGTVWVMTRERPRPRRATPGGRVSSTPGANGSLSNIEMLKSFEISALRWRRAGDALR